MGQIKDPQRNKHDRLLCAWCWLETSPIYWLDCIPCIMVHLLQTPGGTRSGKVRVCEAGPPDPLPPSVRNTPSVHEIVKKIPRSASNTLSIRHMSAPPPRAANTQTNKWMEECYQTHYLSPMLLIIKTDWPLLLKNKNPTFDYLCPGIPEEKREAAQRHMCQETMVIRKEGDYYSIKITSPIGSRDNKFRIGEEYEITTSFANFKVESLRTRSHTLKHNNGNFQAPILDH